MNMYVRVNGKRHPEWRVSYFRVNEFVTRPLKWYEWIELYWLAIRGWLERHGILW
jgi:hypothetical protein